MREAVSKPKCVQAAGVYNITAEVLEAGCEVMIHGLLAVLSDVWQSGSIPSVWKIGLIFLIWQSKGDRQDRHDYYGVALLRVPGKVLTYVVLTRIRSQLLKLQRPEQSRFTPGSSTTDRILALQVLVERRREFWQWLLVADVDLKKAYDSLHRSKLRDILYVRGISTKIIDLMTALLSETESGVKRGWGGGISSLFPVNSGVRQGCVLALSLSNILHGLDLGQSRRLKSL